MAYKKSNANGQATMANSEPVVIASDQSTIPVSVSGVATAANQTTIIGHVDGIEGLLTTIDADTSLLAGAISGTEVQVDVVGALPAGTNNIGDVDVLTLPALPTGSNTIGSIASVTTSIVPGTGATNLGKAEDAVHATGDVGVMALAVRKDTAAASSGTTGDYEPLSTDATGRLWIVGAGIEDVAETAGGVLLMAGTVRRDTAASSAGTTGDNATLNTDSVGALWTRDTATQVDDAAFTPATGRVMPIGYLADETATDSVDEGDAGIARMTLDRKVIVTTQGHTAGGLTIFRSLDLDETEEEVKATGGTVYGMWVTNTATTTRWIKFYNATAASVTVGTTTPVITIGIPGNSSDDISGAFGPSGIGLAFSTAITVAATTGVADSDTGAPGTNDVIINVFYA